jgi:putative ABC transport system permease protein
MHGLKHTWRLLAASPGFTAVIITTLAIGIGATTAVFSIIYGTLLRPLPYKDANRLINILDSSQHEKQLAKIFASYADYEEFSRSSRTLESLAADTWAGRPAAVLTGKGPAKTYLTIPVTYSLFATLGATAALGRTFRKEDLRGGCAVVLANKFWRNHLESDPKIVGRAISLNDHSCTVLGVMPADFALYPPETEIWSLILPNDPALKSFFGVFMIGRLKPGVSLAQANAELPALHRALHAHEGDGEKDFIPLTSGLRDQFTWLAGRNLRTTLALVSAAAFLVLLIGCSNIATLLVGRAVARSREFAIRIAIGSQRKQLFRQLLIESASLSSAGAAFGLLIALGAIRYFVHIQPIELPVASHIAINIPALLFTCLVSMGTAFVFAIGSVWVITRGDIYSRLRVSGANISPFSERLSQLLVATEMGLAVILLAQAGLLMRSVLGVEATPRGFAKDNILAGSGSLPSNYYENAVLRAAFFERLHQQLTSTPGIQNVAIASTLPPYGLGLGTVGIEGKPVSLHHQEHDVANVAVTGGYFELFRISLLHGREFTAHDDSNTPRVAIVNDAFAREYFPVGDTIGHRIRLENDKDWVTVVGVVANEKRPTVYDEMNWIIQPIVYTPIAQHPPPAFSIALESTSNPETIGRVLENSVALIDNHAAVGNTESMRARLAPYLKYPEFRAVLLGVFSLIAVLLAAVGVYGVLAQFVAQSTSSIGIRKAIGATTSDLLSLIFWKAGMPAIIGLFAGLFISSALTRYWRSVLYGVTATDPATFTIVALVILAAGMLAAIPPSRRLLRVDPMIALRTE